MTRHDVGAINLNERQQVLESLRNRAATLEPDAVTRAARLNQVATHSEHFLEHLPQRGGWSPDTSRDAALAALSVGEDPYPFDDALQSLAEHVDGTGHNLGSSRFFAYIPSGGLYDAALADFLAAVSNRYAGVGAASPGASRVEEVLLDWLAKVVGYPETTEGDLTSGGSVATLSAIIAAREAHSIRAADIPTTTLYLSAQTHHTFQKALRVAGMNECVVREVPLDENLRMDCTALREMLRQDADANLNPWLIAASAGTTDAGAVDPLDVIADIAAEHKVWLHVDAAYGGAFALCEPGRARLRGLQRSDSLVLDPHKGLFIPCGIGAVLVRDGRHLFDAFHSRGVYMQDVSSDTARAPCDFSVELTRHFRALRLWLPVKVNGTAAFAAALEEKLLLAEYFYEELAGIAAIVPGSKPDLTVVTFRHARDTRALYAAIRDDGRIMASTTTINDQFTIRLAILAYNTHIEEIELALDVIRDCVARLEGEPI